MDAVTNVPTPANEPVRGYAPGSPERARLQAELAEQAAQAPIDLPMTIGGRTPRRRDPKSPSCSRTATRPSSDISAPPPRTTPETPSTRH